jgi:hypothetical protein
LTDDPFPNLADDWVSWRHLPGTSPSPGGTVDDTGIVLDARTGSDLITDNRITPDRVNEKYGLTKDATVVNFIPAAP